VSALARLPFFKDCGIDLAAYERRCLMRKFDEGEVAVDFEDASADVYFLLSGEMRVLIRTQAGKEVILGEIRAGQFFGELSAIDGTPRSANVAALTRTEVCIMPTDVFHDLVFSTPVLAERVARLLTARVRELNARLMEKSVLDLRHRLYSELLRMSVPRAGHPSERVVTPPPYHHVLAARIGCRREQVTREFTTLSGESLIEKTRGAIVLRRPQVLQQRIAEALRERE